MNMRYNGLIASCILSLLALTACGQASKPPAPTVEESVANSEHFTMRELRDPVYIEAATDFSGGDGTESSPYQITKASQLVLLSDIISRKVELDIDDEMRYKEGHYILMNDIEINDVSNFEHWGETPPTYDWNPIASTDELFVLDGQGFAVRGLYINTNQQIDDYGNKGLFDINYGTIKNIKLENAFLSVSGTMGDVGALAGWNHGVIENISCDAIMECYQGNVGGIVGKNHGTMGNAVFSGSITDAQDNTDAFMGGICATNDGEIANCTNYGTLSSSLQGGDYIGGIVADFGGGVIRDCVNEGALTGQFNTGGIAGSIYVLDIGGDHENKSATIERCINKGTLSGCDELVSYVGGIAGSATTDNSAYFVLIDNCINEGALSAPNEGTAGGIVGNVSVASKEDGYLKIANCTNLSDLTGSNAGGIVTKAAVSKGHFIMESCLNHGTITATELYAGGILAQSQSIFDYEKEISITSCENSGTITGPTAIGGIIGIIENVLNHETDGCAVTISDNHSKGDLVAAGLTTRVGGIVGHYGVGKTPATISHCTALGTVDLTSTVLTAEEIEENKKAQEENKSFALTRVTGGIIGRIGYGLFLSTDQDDKDFSSSFNVDDGFIHISDCHSGLSIQNLSEDEVVINEIGGVIGNFSGSTDFSCKISQCTFDHFDSAVGTEGVA